MGEVYSLDILFVLRLIAWFVQRALFGLFLMTQTYRKIRKHFRKLLAVDVFAMSSGS